jgi:hypothetical protein
VSGSSTGIVCPSAVRPSPTTTELKRSSGRCSRTGTRSLAPSLRSDPSASRPLWPSPLLPCREARPRSCRSPRSNRASSARAKRWPRRRARILADSDDSRKGRGRLICEQPARRRLALPGRTVENIFHQRPGKVPCRGIAASPPRGTYRPQVFEFIRVYPREGMWGRPWPLNCNILEQNSFDSGESVQC